MLPTAPIAIVPITTDGTSLTVTLPQELVIELGLRAGTLMQVFTADNGIIIQRCDSAVQRQIEIAKEVMRDRQEVLRRLAE